MYKIAMEQQKLQEAIYFGRIDDDEDVLDQVCVDERVRREVCLVNKCFNCFTPCSHISGP